MQKTAEAASENAVKLEKARAMAIEKVMKAIEQMPDGSGSHMRRTVNDDKGRPVVMDYDLPALVQSLEKLMLQSARGADGDRDEVTVIIDV